MDSKIKTYLDRLAASPKRPNSFLFSGTGEEEKNEAAFYFILELAGKKGEEEFLQKIKEGIHPDVVIVEPEIAEDKKGRTREKEIVIEQIRRARQKLMYFPYELPRKFCIIKKAGRMNAESSNALLKILEEPTEGTFFILLADYSDSVLSTVASRCAELRFPETNLPEWSEENREKFRRILKEEIFEKFDYIEKISKDKNEFVGVLKDWEAVAAEGLRKLIMENRGNLGDKGNRGRVGRVVELIEDMREAINQLERTNASARAVGEKLLLKM